MRSASPRLRSPVSTTMMLKGNVPENGSRSSDDLGISVGGVPRQSHGSSRPETYSGTCRSSFDSDGHQRRMETGGRRARVDDRSRTKQQSRTAPRRRPRTATWFSKPRPRSTPGIRYIIRVASTEWIGWGVCDPYLPIYDWEPDGPSDLEGADRSRHGAMAAVRRCCRGGGRFARRRRAAGKAAAHGSGEDSDDSPDAPGAGRESRRSRSGGGE